VINQRGISLNPESSSVLLSFFDSDLLTQPLSWLSAQKGCHQFSETFYNWNKNLSEENIPAISPKQIHKQVIALNKTDSI
jgi:hypothetical protein